MTKGGIARSLHSKESGSGSSSSSNSFREAKPESFPATAPKALHRKGVVSSTKVPRTFAQACDDTAELLHSSVLLQQEAGQLLDRLRENCPARPAPDLSVVNGAEDAPFGWLELGEFRRLTPAQKDDYLSEVALQLLAVEAKPQSRVERLMRSSNTALELGRAPSTGSRDAGYEQVQIDAQVFLARFRLNRSRTVELCQRSSVNCMMAEQTLARARDLMEKSRELRYGRADQRREIEARLGEELEA